MHCIVLKPRVLPKGIAYWTVANVLTSGVAAKLKWSGTPIFKLEDPTVEALGRAHGHLVWDKTIPPPI